MCVFITGVGQGLPSEPQCGLYQGKQGEVSQSVRGKTNTRFIEGRNLAAVEGIVLVYQVYFTSNKTGEGGRRL